VYDLAMRLSAGSDIAIEAATTKLACCENYNTVADRALQVFGGYGYTEEFSVARHYRDARILRIAAGSAEIQRNIIAKVLKGTTAA
jgi:short/branched chain acyl-CoA dehydrogenase